VKRRRSRVAGGKVRRSGFHANDLFQKKTHEYEKHKAKVYAYILSQCDDAMTNRLQTMHGYEEVDEKTAEARGASEERVRSLEDCLMTVFSFKE